jgi:hypothetical protein
MVSGSSKIRFFWLAGTQASSFFDTRSSKAAFVFSSIYSATARTVPPIALVAWADASVGKQCFVIDVSGVPFQKYTSRYKCEWKHREGRKRVMSNIKARRCSWARARLPGLSERIIAMALGVNLTVRPNKFDDANDKRRAIMDYAFSMLGLNRKIFERNDSIIETYRVLLCMPVSSIHSSGYRGQGVGLLYKTRYVMAGESN